MKIYLAGPMRGYENFNFPAFIAAAKELRAAGHEVFNPAERDTAEWGEITSLRGDEEEFAKQVGLSALDMKRRVFYFDSRYITTQADAVAVLPGWERSLGAQAEVALAKAVGLIYDSYEAFL